MAGEFDLIRQYFQPLSNIPTAINVQISNGDDCAVIEGEGQQAFSIDTQVSGVHFLEQLKPYDIAWRGFAAALSDLAAMGARPDYFTLALSLTGRESDDWLRQYSDGLRTLAERYHTPLLGGDTTRAPVVVQTFQVQGTCLKAPLTRSGGQAGDIIYVSGTLGDPMAGLMSIQNHDGMTELEQAYLHPTPEIALGMKIADIANACIDVSDGLLGDLGHICEQSGYGAELNLQNLPLSDAFRRYVPIDNQWTMALTGGDDYRLCFTIPEQHRHRLQGLNVFPIGQLVERPGIECLDSDKQPVIIQGTGFDHFR